MATRRFRISCCNATNLPYSVTVESQITKRILFIESSAVLTYDENCFPIEQKDRYLKVCDAYGLLGILRTNADESYIVACTGVSSIGQLYNCDIYRITMIQLIPLQKSTSEFIDPRLIDLQQLASSGIFYFANSTDPKQLFDLTLSTERRLNADNSDNCYFWNKSLHYYLEHYSIDSNEWFLRIMCGSVQIRKVYAGYRTAKVAVLSRLSSNRVGTRFNVRGVDDDGNVANFIETEQLITYDNNDVSFVQIRGSVPLFWDQSGINVGSHKIKLRAFDASGPAYERHLNSLKMQYGKVVMVNLLGSKLGEKTLSEAFKTRHKSTIHSDVDLIAFDYHAQMKSSKSSVRYFMNKLIPMLNNFSFFHFVDGIQKRAQVGVVRTNCLDCLDRTNCVQTLIGLEMLNAQLKCLSFDATQPNLFLRFEDALKELWQKNGDFCSIIYAGTGALEGKSKLKDASRSIARTIQNNLMDSNKQEAFDLFIHSGIQTRPINDQFIGAIPQMILQENSQVVDSLAELKDQMVDEVPISIFAGTWNVNGGKNMLNIAFRNQAPLSEWLFTKESLVNVSDENSEADIYAIGLEEIVDLNASNIVKASTTNQRLWCDGLRKALCERTRYVLLASEQLVGVCLYIFIKPSLVPFVRDTAIDSVKTGMGGATGNKGSVSIRFNLFSTSVCFVCSHFAAGQNEVRDRNDDYKTALRKIRFPMGRDILSHDLIIWLGDFNYRISLPGEEVKKAVRAGLFDQLASNDQLTQQRACENVFFGFEEGKLNFDPTYKYDTFSDDYDTSEKCRAPAWTDRILWRNSTKWNLIDLKSYGRVELKTSDHRPVRAFFRLKAQKINPLKCENVFIDVVSSSGPPDATVLVSVPNLNVFPKFLCSEILSKLSEQLGINVLLSKIDGGDLWLLLESGEMALAALSMDGAVINNNVLDVRLRTPDWVDVESSRVKKTLKELSANESYEYSSMENGEDFEFQDEEEESTTLRNCASSSELSSQGNFYLSDAFNEQLCEIKCVSTENLPSPFGSKCETEEGITIAVPKRLSPIPPQVPPLPQVPSRSSSLQRRADAVDGFSLVNFNQDFSKSLNLQRTTVPLVPPRPNLNSNS